MIKKLEDLSTGHAEGPPGKVVRNSTKFLFDFRWSRMIKKLEDTYQTGVNRPTLAKYGSDDSSIVSAGCDETANDEYY